MNFYEFWQLLNEELEATVSILKQKYPNIPGITIDLMSKSLPEQSLEWAVSSIAKGKGRWPEDAPRFQSAWNFFKTPIFKQWASKMFTDKHPKNPLMFTLHDVEKIEDASKPKESKRQQVRDVKQEGAKVAYDKPPYKIIQIGGPGVDIEKAAQAASYYAKGTKWCTSDPNTAKEYLSEGPLYIIFEDNQKIGQYEPESGQLMDLEDDDLEPTEGLRDAFWSIGIRTDLATWFDLGKWSEAEPYIMKDPAYAYHYAKNTICGRWPEAEPYIMKDPVHTYLYAHNIIHGRWTEAEPFIMKNPEYAYCYANNIINGRWPEAEPYIMKNPKYTYNYADNIIHGRWPEAEPYIMKDPVWSYHYAAHVIHGRWLNHIL
jgi:hypothetical protein